MPEEKKNASSEKTPNIHKDHRDRVRNRFLRDGLNRMEEHVKLELLLYYAVPQKDTNPMAHELLERFGSFSSVFEASVEDLMKVKGIGKNCAVLIKMIPQLASAYLEDKEKNAVRFHDKESISKYLQCKFIGQKTEALAVVALDSQNRLQYCEIIQEGDTNMVPVSIKDILGIAIRCKASSIVIAHNHPSGVLFPSGEDLALTARVYRVLQGINIELQDHILVVDGNTLSLRDSGLLDKALSLYETLPEPSEKGNEI